MSYIILAYVHINFIALALVSKNHKFIHLHHSFAVAYDTWQMGWDGVAIS